MQPVEKRVAVGGIELVYFEWGKPASPTILLIHATGFHARCWDQVVARLPGQHIIAVDMRGHGRSSKTGPYTWKKFGEDVIELIEQLQLDSIIGVGHSMGGHSITQAAAMLPDRFERLVLVDPVILSPEIYGNDSMATAFPEGHPVARRRNHFTSPQAMYDNFHGRGSYAAWTPEALMDYCRFGLQEYEDGHDYRLACPPDVEASIYMGNFGCDVHGLVPKIDLPVTVMRAMQRTEQHAGVMDFNLSPTWPGLADEFPDGRDVYLPELTHFMPMQDPGLVADYIVNEIAAV